MSGTKRISALTEHASTDLAEADLFVVVDASQSSVTDKTKKISAGSLLASTNTDAKVSFKTVALLVADTARIGYSSARYNVSEGDIVAAGPYRYQVAASGASDHNVATAGGVKLYVMAGSAGELPAAAFKTGTDTAAVQAAITAAGSTGTVSVGPDMAPDWSTITSSNDVMIFDAASGRIIAGKGPAMESGGTVGGGRYIVFRPPTEDYSYLYVVPRGEAYGEQDFAAAVKVFGRDYKAGIRLDGVTDASNVDYPVFVMSVEGRDDVPHGGRAGLASKVTKDFGPVHPDIEFLTGIETNRGALRIAYMEPSFTPAGPYTAASSRIMLIKGAAWRPGISVTQGDRAMVYGRVYEACESGTTGSSPMGFDDTGGRQLNARNSGTTTVGTSETVNGWPGYTGSDGNIKWAFIADVYYGSGWTGWKQHVLIGDPGTEGIPATGLFGQFTSDFGIRRGASIEAISPIDGAKEARLSAATNSISMEAGATKGSASNPRVVVSTAGITLDQGPVIIGTAATKTDGATTYDLSTNNKASAITFNDSGATNFTAFSNGLARQRVTLLFQSGNTTLINSSSLRIPGGNWTPAQYTVVDVYMVSASVGWVQKW